MEDKNHENGMEEANNSYEQIKAELRLAAKSPARQKQHIAAIAKYLGYEVEVGPITDNHNGVEYTFDFHETETGRRFKVFTSSDEDTHRLYADCPSKPVLIYDSDEIMLQSDHESDEELVLIMDENRSQLIYQDPFVFEFFCERLYMYGGHPEGDSVWRKMVPYLTFWENFEIHKQLACNT